MKDFCVLPWYGQEINLVTNQQTVCCWLHPDVSRSELQQQFLSGARPQACQKCWKNEEQGIESRRQIENRFLDSKMDRDIEWLQQNAVMGRSEINLYQIFLGSICNGTCVTCGSHFSSAWRSLEKNTRSIRLENITTQGSFDQHIGSINWQEAKRFNLLGGEPLLLDRSWSVLEKLIEVGNTDCRISFVTNGSVKLSQQQLDLISKFSDISCCVSIDGLDKTFEYIRYPLSWTTLLQNLEIYRTVFPSVEVSFTVSNLNQQHRHLIIQWLQDQNLPFIENYVQKPAFFHYQVDHNHKLWPQFVQEIRRQDQLKGISIGDYIPHIAEMIQQHDR